MPRDTGQAIRLRKRKRKYIQKSASAAIHELWIAALFRSTYFEDFYHKPNLDNRISQNNAPCYNRVRFLSLWGLFSWTGQAQCRSPPSDFDFTNQQKRNRRKR